MRTKEIKPEKVQAVETIKDMLNGFKAFYLVDFTGWTVAQMTEIRRTLKQNDARMRVVKNTLLRIALKQKGIEGLDEYLQGPSALVVSYRDEIQPLKLIHKFIKDTEKGKLKIAYLDGQVFANEQLDQLVKLPSLDELRMKVVGGVASPLYGLVNALNGLMSSLVNVLNQIKDKKGE